VTLPAARLGLALCLACVAAAAAFQGQQRGGARPPAEGPQPQFQDVTEQARLDFLHTNGASPDKHIVETMGSGGVFLDYDNDGWLDVFLVDGGSLADPMVARRTRHRLYRNRRDGTFEDVTSASRLVHQGFGMGACAGDHDNDGWIDLYVTSDGADMLYRNTGQGTFSDVTRSAGIGSTRMSTSCAFADIDRDGDLDLFVAHYVNLGAGEVYCGDNRVRAYCRPDVYRGLPNVLYRNNGDGTFADLTREAGLLSTAGKGLGVVFGDYDDDGWPDLFVANDLVPNFLYHNEGRGVFREIGLLAGVAVASDGKSRAGMGTDFGDYDGDGRLDLVVTNFELETHNLFRNLGDGLFADATAQSGLNLATVSYLGFGAVFLDYDNDGDLDLAIANGHVLDNAPHFRANASHAQRNLLLRNDGGRLRDVGPGSGPGLALVKVSRALAAGDIDNDGDLDLLVTNNGQRPDLLRNDGGNRSAALMVRAVGKQSNRSGVGARIRLVAGGKTQLREVKAGSSYLSQSDLRQHFGLGRARQADRLEIRWPSGRTEVLQNIAAGAVVTIVEGEGITTRTPFTAR
jgi:enediyne biosynthesis protein E4